MIVTKHLSKVLLLSILTFIGFSCKKDASSPRGTGVGVNPNAWLIPSDQVQDGGPGKDGIPSIDQPNFSPVSAINFLDNTNLVIGVRVGDEVRAYPHPILDWHEIVNDEIGSTRVAVTYCPLTGTAIGWNREVDGQLTSFGVSGLLYNTNLMPYDRNSDSYWSQMRLECVNGDLVGSKIEVIPLVETTWGTWKTLYPESKVLNTTTGFNRSYGIYPYGTYRTNNNQILFPITPDDSRLPRKERVLGIISGGDAKAYRFNSFPGSDITVLEDEFNGLKLILAGSTGLNFMVAYERVLEDGTELTFLPFEGDEASNIIMWDEEGNNWDAFGMAVSGPREGERLKSTDSYIGYWLSWGAFYPGLDIFQ